MNEKMANVEKHLMKEKLGDKPTDLSASWCV